MAARSKVYAVARLLRLWVRIPPEAWMSLCCECIVLSGRGPCDELVTRPEESYRLWCVIARLLRLWVRIPPEAWMSLCCECLVLSGRGPCDELVTRPEESYRLWRVVVCDLETSWMRKPCSPLGRSVKKVFFKKCSWSTRLRNLG
jgi:hypothetical protein